MGRDTVDGRLRRGLAARLRIGTAALDDAAEIALLRTAVAERLTTQYGHGHWSGVVTDRLVLGGMKHSRVLVARDGDAIVGTLRLATRKPWAIDARYFTKVARPLYLTDMAVAPRVQRQGVGRRLLREAAEVATAWPAGAIRLDSYDAEAGAAPFYWKCGFRETGRVTYRGTPLVYFERVLGA